MASDGRRRTEPDEEVVRRDGLECPSRRTTPPSRGEQSERTCLKHRYSHDVLSSGSGDLDAQAACGTGSVRAHRATRHGALVTGAQTSRAQTMLPLRRPYNGLEGVLHLHINAYLYWNQHWPIIRCQIWRRAGARTPADSPERKAEHVASAPLFSGAGPKNLVPARRHFSV